MACPVHHRIVYLNLTGGGAAHIRKKRLTAATRMLLHPRYSRWRIAEIAYYWQLEPATFNRLFIVAYGTTPTQARKQRQDIWSLDAMEESQVAWLRSL